MADSRRWCWTLILDSLVLVQWPPIGFILFPVCHSPTLLGSQSNWFERILFPNKKAQDCRLQWFLHCLQMEWISHHHLYIWNLVFKRMIHLFLSLFPSKVDTFCLCPIYFWLPYCFSNYVFIVILCGNVVFIITGTTQWSYIWNTQTLVY